MGLEMGIKRKIDTLKIKSPCVLEMLVLLLLKTEQASNTESEKTSLSLKLSHQDSILFMSFECQTINWLFNHHHNIFADFRLPFISISPRFSSFAIMRTSMSKTNMNHEKSFCTFLQLSLPHTHSLLCLTFVTKWP